MYPPLQKMLNIKVVKLFGFTVHKKVRETKRLYK